LNISLSHNQFSQPSYLKKNLFRLIPPKAQSSYRGPGVVRLIAEDVNTRKETYRTNFDT
jgi:hypothetical protein